MANPRYTVYRAANHTVREMKQLFNRLGNRQHPRGRITSAYRNAHRALRDVYRRGGAQYEVAEVVEGLARDVRGAAVDALEEARALGALQAQREAEAWGLIAAAPLIDTLAPLTAWSSIVDGQGMAALAEPDPAVVLNSLLLPGPVVRSGVHWIAITVIGALVSSLEAPIAATGVRWGKQAIAAIDDRTTDCCLRVHGQVVEFEKKFHLTGEPRFDDWQDWSPFHWNCRTSVGSVPMDEVDDDLTRRMLVEAAAEQKARRDARSRIAEIRQELIDLRTAPDARKRAADTAEITGLRAELSRLRDRVGYEGGE